MSTFCPLPIPPLFRTSLSFRRGSSTGVAFLTHGESVRICFASASSHWLGGLLVHGVPEAMSRAANAITNGAFDTLCITHASFEWFMAKHLLDTLPWPSQTRTTVSP